ncbi:HAMP domain-containing histidine kinase [Cryobacterium levicorallinum]|uniref:Sensor-like histidine kinase SenX3 n=1 Tax=Cryobacterium levicorallinum TaxID=995038 RepID=A0A1I3E2H3_9MICO|nr:MULTISPECIES: HAMP domain-containing sensor histidine kinase [Cryobacterium]TFB81489.1 HAMP domain-containing histidine kinase [Cryobacterium levicorallinum]GEP28529.1 two-component sensor histidine kinase [Cryobacterium levicorallinum]SFH93174.1 Signal transduction histidine kinase [Cryobacterium levicorallinum]
MTASVFAAVAGIALGCALVVGALGLLALRLLSRGSLVAQIVVVAFATVASVVSGTAAVASLMYLSAHDLIVFYAVAAVAGVVSLVMASVLGRSLARDNKYFRAAAASIGRGESVLSPDRHTSLEFAALAGELAATADRLTESREREERVEASRREIVAWISHDLRTPLAGIRAMAEALEDGMAPDPERYYVQIRGQVDRLSGMVDDLFELSKIHSGALQLSLERVSLYDLMSDTVADLAPVALAKSLDLRFEGERGLMLQADARQLARAVGNLVMNAIQHSPADSVIVVSATRHVDGRAIISVVDAAGGIPEQDLGRVFEAGWRASEPRTVSAWGTGGRSGGAGLGLAIVQGIAEAHHGLVTVTNVGNGCRFDLLLPQHPLG